MPPRLPFGSPPAGNGRGDGGVDSPPPRPSRLLFGVLPGQETAGTLRTPRFPLGVPLPRLGSGRIPGCGPAA